LTLVSAKTFSENTTVSSEHRDSDKARL